MPTLCETLANSGRRIYNFVIINIRIRNSVRRIKNQELRIKNGNTEYRIKLTPFAQNNKMLLWIIPFALLGSIFSTIGGVILLKKENLARRASIFLITFAAGVLLGVSFLDLLPESVEGIGSVNTAAWYALGAIAVLFIVERFLWWYHHHRFEAQEHHVEHYNEHTLNPSQVYLLLIGDAIHNFIDGVVIAAAFMVNIPLGVAVSVGVVIHEVPQEIADFGLMLSAGFTKARTLFLNLLTASTTLVGALIAYIALISVESIVPYLLAIAMGVFVYIALSDLIPAIHHQSEHKHDWVQFLLFVGGILIVFLIGLSSGAAHLHEHEEGHEEENKLEEEHSAKFMPMS